MDPLSHLMQRYCFAYTATHDFSVADQIMVDDYTFYMGESVFVGREAAYKPAAERQFQAYPGLGFTVHDFFSNGDRCAMYFSEFGHSIKFQTDVAWHGVSLYRWDARRLTECRIEQDYYGRRRQLESKRPDPVGQPAYAPWTAAVRAADASSERVASAWLHDGGLLKSEAGSLDDEQVAPSAKARVQFRDARTEILDILSAGLRVAFQVRIDGNYEGGLKQLAGREGVKAQLYATGIADLANGAVVRVRAVTDRYNMERRILSKG
ncbi:MAG TPA: nuclear transport factor 2 family protein [Steroidobacteraceae bacterium]|nr:nuclear transport factor 2 family protein [Steroidobacteraceae bacterium]